MAFNDAPKQQVMQNAEEFQPQPDIEEAELIRSEEAAPYESELQEEDKGLCSGDFANEIARLRNQVAAISSEIVSMKQAIAQSQDAFTADIAAAIRDLKACIDRFDREDDSDLASRVDSMEKTIVTLADKIEHQDRKLMRALKENTNFQVDVRKGMQQDIEKYKEQLRGDWFVPVLTEIANTYVDYCNVLNEEDIPERVKKNLISLFEQLEEILNDYGADIIRSEVGSVRSPRTTRVVGKVPTGDEKKHNTIVISRRPGVVKDRTVLVHEYADIYIYDELFVSSESSNASEQADF